MATQVSERQARRVAEEARETEWKLPSFCRELFLGALRIDLIHPQPRLDQAAASRGAAFLRKLSQFLEAEVDPLQIERDARIPAEVLDGLKALGALGMKVPEEYGGLGLSQVTYNRALWSPEAATPRCRRSSPRTSRSAWPSPCSSRAARSRSASGSRRSRRTTCRPST